MQENWNSEGRQMVDRTWHAPGTDDIWELFANAEAFPGQGIEWFVDRITSRLEKRP